MSPVTLPADLERTIFEITAFAAPECIPRLVLVAWRVKIWLEPILYRTLVIEGKRHNLIPFLDTLASKPAAFFADSTRHLFMDDFDPSAMRAILSACSQVENLWVINTSAGTHILLPFH
ncbi:hypothetical protein MSAN_00146000 [Mycena sanguinolenta]|uniref:Uncharacterized protein n=1 Tax=Mycena sanguinolenta TaxID=230812 RepID=A0A8H6ZH12_9AGAR|nr:hypothetical protein MSAN_00146000 [Mycena sanguinolenta]